MHDQKQVSPIWSTSSSAIPLSPTTGSMEIAQENRNLLATPAGTGASELRALFNLVTPGLCTSPASEWLETRVGDLPLVEGGHCGGRGLLGQPPMPFSQNSGASSRK